MNTASEFPVDAVTAGDRFYKVGAGDSVWIVLRVFVGKADGIPHAVLVREDESDHKTVISVLALLEENRFKPDRRNPQAENDTKKQRRRTDWYPRRLWKKLTG